ncbi:MAG: hypothetical protein IPK07_33615 [Deltaproteobacteria bacterium]|nr:hypothetical protein [Deltaproteobacteria bacterium]MCC6900288.1 hypothetical protein [Polyangiaceae bacterium]
MPNTHLTRGLLVAGALLLSGAVGTAHAATAEKAKGAKAITSTCVDEIWEIRAVPADKVGTSASGSQTVVIDPSPERSDETPVGEICPTPTRRTVIQIVPKIG